MGVVAGIVVGVFWSNPVQAATVEYQGPDGNVDVPGNWYVITDPGDPASRTGETRLPLKYSGTYPTGTPGDLAIVRNGTTTTVNGSLDAQYLSLGGPVITGQPTGSPTTVYVPSGSTVSMYSDDPFNPLRLNIGGPYPATLHVNGGNVNVFARHGGGIYVGTSSTGTGVMNISSGIVSIQRPAVGNPLLAVGFNGGNGRINQTGGSMLVVGDTGGSTTNFRLGAGGYGQVDLSNGWFQIDSVSRIGHEWTDPDEILPDVPGTGLFTITGGTFQYGYRISVGDGNRGDANVGHLRFLGGTVQSDPTIDPAFASHLWVGRGMNGTATPGAIGKMTYNQSVVIDSHGLLEGRDGWDTTNTQTEVKINSDADFKASFDELCIMQGALEVSLTDGYRPASGTDWLIADSGPHPTIWALDVRKITPGFRVEARNLDIYLVCDALVHPGDANNDGAVDESDLGILEGNWNQDTILGKAWEDGDFTGDDLVNVNDLEILNANWGWRVPEPASLSLLLAGALALIRRRR
jgi:hypothetical protein